MKKPGIGVRSPLDQGLSLEEAPAQYRVSPIREEPIRSDFNRCFWLPNSSRGLCETAN
jgi:hypothetical protein